MPNPTRTFSPKQEDITESQSREIRIVLNSDLWIDIKAWSGSDIVVIDLLDAAALETTSIELFGRESLEKIMSLIAFALEV